MDKEYTLEPFTSHNPRGAEVLVKILLGQGLFEGGNFFLRSKKLLRT